MKARPKKCRRSSEKQSAPKKKILIIDADLVMTELLRSYLGQEKGFEVLTAETGADGIRTAIEHQPDLILLDFRLSDMRGLEVHERLRQNSTARETPVIYVSYFLTLRAIEEATGKGARGFISKPFNLSQMYTKVANVLSSS